MLRAPLPRVVPVNEGALMFDLDRSYDALDTCLGKDTASAQWTTHTLKPAPRFRPTSTPASAAQRSGSWERVAKLPGSGRLAEPSRQRTIEHAGHRSVVERLVQQLVNPHLLQHAGRESRRVTGGEDDTQLWA